MEEVEQSLIHLQLVPGERVGGKKKGRRKAVQRSSRSLRFLWFPLAVWAGS